jgi:prepilin-type N-terminal cleavage/methylation domain-containing protein
MKACNILSSTETSRPGCAPGRRSGFSLMEVSFALLIASVGLLALLSLFPVGLRQGQQASSDTGQAAFADMVLNAMRANASTITNWTDWTDHFTNLVMQGITAPQVGGPLVQIHCDYPTIHQIPTPDYPAVPNLQTSGYLVKGRYMAYRLAVYPVTTNSYVCRAFIQAIDRPYADVEKSPIYVTDFVFQGM